MTRLFLFLVILALPVSAEATYYWADPTGTNNRNCAQMDSVDSATDPGSYGTINRAAVCATSPGDVVIIKAGNYTGTNNQLKMDANCTGTCLASGTSESVRTIIMADPAAGTTPVIKVANWYQTYIAAPRNYITIKNLKIDVSNGAGSLESDGGGASILLGGHHVTIENVEIVNSYNMAIFTYYGATTNNLIIRNSSFHGYGIDGNGYAVYLEADNSTIENNIAYSAKGAGFQIYSDTAGVTPINATIRGNYIYDMLNATQAGVVGFCSGILIEGSGHVISRNIIQGSGCTAGAIGYGISAGYNSTDSVKIYNNIILNWRSDGIVIGQGGVVVTGANETKNNIVFGNTGAEINIRNGSTNTSSNNACAAADSCGTTNKLTIAALTDCTPGSTTYTQKSGSSCINAGVAITGFNYNGAAPDIGVFESFVLATCAVENATPTVINATFTNNVYPPLLPSTGVTTFTARKATVNNVVTGVVRTGDNQLDITVTDTFVAGNAIDISWASGNLTDSANIGGSSWGALRQPFLPITNSACTNNTAGAPSHLFIQAKFEFHGLRGTEAAPVVLPYSAAAENTNINVVVGGKARLRLALTCTTADCPPTGFYLYYSKDGGAYAVVPDSFGADNIAFCGNSADADIPTSGTATTDQLSTAGTFVAAALVRTSNAIPTIDLAQNNKTEPEYCLSWDTDATADATYDFRIYKQDATAIDTYTVTPRATVRAMSAGLGF